MVKANYPRFPPLPGVPRLRRKDAGANRFAGLRRFSEEFVPRRVRNRGITRLTLA
jgi:hypothetical protein